MSTEMTLFRDSNAKLPAHLTRNLDDLTKSLMGGSSVGKRISILGGVWRMIVGGDRKSTRLNSSHSQQSRMPSSA